MLLDQQPPIKEITTHARTAKWKDLGVQLELNDTTLAECHDCTTLYQSWITEKGKSATRRELISALKEIREINVACKYEQHLQTVSV